MNNFKYTFFDNQTIGVDQLNEITSRLVSGGISAVYSGADFSVSDINNSNYTILCGGVVPEGDSNLKVTSLGGGKYLINQGVCFFDDGTVMEILSGGEEISVPLGQAKYVYLTSDKNKMACYVEIIDSQKETGVFQLLAYIDGTGKISDRRSYARGKVPGFYSSNSGKNVNITITYGDEDIRGVESVEVPVGEGNFSHLLIKSSFGKGTFYYCDLSNGFSENVVHSSGSTSSFYLFYDSLGGWMEALENIRIENGKLIIKLLNSFLNDSRKAAVSYYLW